MTTDNQQDESPQPYEKAIKIFYSANTDVTQTKEITNNKMLLFKAGQIDAKPSQLEKLSLDLYQKYKTFVELRSQRSTHLPKDI